MTKLTFVGRPVFLMAVLCVLLGLVTRAQAPGKINLDVKNVPLTAVLAAIEKQTGTPFIYNQQQVEKVQVTTASYHQKNLTEVLNHLLGQYQFGYKMEGGNIILFPQVKKDEKKSATGPGKVTGKITDEENGQPIAGATIHIGNKGLSTDMEGAFTVTLPKGSYTATISYVEYGTKEVSQIVVKDDETFPLNVTLKREKGNLTTVVVRSSARKESVNALLSRQKNAAELSNGISAEQIARTPDKNIGESLKRISGVSSVDNKFVLVRGIGERYNSAMLDGVALPSTEAQSRNFSFDLIPSNMVDNVVVSKTVTPDMNASFGGGLIQINTKDIPHENFASFSAGASYNDQATGKDFISHKRGKYDYFGFDDGRRDFPKDFTSTSGLTPEQITEQGKKFTNDNFTVYNNKAAPSQNYQFTIGRLFALDTTSNNKLGFTGSLSYRNTQSNNIIDQMTRGDWNQTTTNTGNAFGFNTTLGGLLNVGLQLGKNRFSFRNTYTHLYDNTLYRILGHSFDSPQPTNGDPGRILEVDDPTFTDLMQNKLSGQHQLGKIKVEWNAARTSVNREEKDLIFAESFALLIGSEYFYYNRPTVNSEPRINPLSRHHYQNNEKNYSWDAAATIPFTIGDIRSNVKAGYFGNQRKADFDWVITSFTRSSSLPDSVLYLPIGEMIKPVHLGPEGFQWTTNSSDRFEGKSHNHAGFIMFDNRLAEKLRLVWGVRGEYYKYTEIENGNNTRLTGFVLKPDQRWQWLPSANLTYSPISSLNIRAAYSSSVVRPELRDNSQFFRYSPYLGGTMGNMGLYSTRINSWDIKTEWFSGLGEIISVGVFYKKFDKPTELERVNQGNTTNYYLKSADWAKVYGLEFELRKNLGFILDNAFLNNLTAYGNLTLQRSEVRSTYLSSNPDPSLPDLELTNKQSRPIYGQTPYLINAGLQYSGDHFGFNVMYNKSGYKTYLVAEIADMLEYERPREQVDAQISYRFLKNSLEIRLNASNLLNGASTFYRNTASYEPNPDFVPGESLDISDAQRLKPGFTDKYEDGDRIMFSQKFGRTYSATLTWNF